MIITMSNMSGLPLPTPEEAARFLGHATLGYTLAEVNDLAARGYKAWFDTQFALYDQQRLNPNVRHASHFDWLKTTLPPVGPDAMFQGAQLTQSVLRRSFQGTDTLTQRMTFALSQILVVSIRSDLGTSWPQYLAAAYLDMIQRNSLGNYRALLGEVSRHPAMTRFLTFLGSRAATASTSPDENYARELLQLFTIGLLKLDQDGTPVAGNIETYQNEHVRTLANIFTGWRDVTWDQNDIERFRQPSININDGLANDTAPRTLNINAAAPTTITSTDPVTRLKQALDHIFSHPNVAPFIGKQLIQRLVTSNPSPAYVGNVAQAFSASGGDLKKVAVAVLMDESLFDGSLRRRAGLGDTKFGKVREPWCRLVHWGRAFGATSRSGKWAVPFGDIGLEQPTQLGQVPMLAPSVFNFFRPGYVPPSSVTASVGQGKLVAPEFQIIDEVSLVSYVNFMKQAIDPLYGVGGMSDVSTSYAGWIAKAGNPAALMDDLSLVLTAGRLKGFPGGVVSLNYTRIKNAISTMPIGTDVQRRQRVQAAILMVMASPEYLVQQ